MTNEEGDSSFDDLIDALAARQRRRLLIALVEDTPQDVSEGICADAETDADALGQRVLLCHCHLPKLADSGFIEWHGETHTVTRGPNFDAIRPLLELLADHEDELPADWV
jgi:predicted transcriptional regulator